MKTLIFIALFSTVIWNVFGVESEKGVFSDPSTYVNLKDYNEVDSIKVVPGEYGTFSNTEDERPQDELFNEYFDQDYGQIIANLYSDLKKDKQKDEIQKYDVNADIRQENYNLKVNDPSWEDLIDYGNPKAYDLKESLYQDYVPKEKESEENYDLKQDTKPVDYVMTVDSNKDYDLMANVNLEEYDMKADKEDYSQNLDDYPEYDLYPEGWIDYINQDKSDLKPDVDEDYFQNFKDPSMDLIGDNYIKSNNLYQEYNTDYMQAEYSYVVLPDFNPATDFDLNDGEMRVYKILFLDQSSWNQLDLLNNDNGLRGVDIDLDDFWYEDFQGQLSKYENFDLKPSDSQDIFYGHIPSDDYDLTDKDEVNIVFNGNGRDSGDSVNDILFLNSIQSAPKRRVIVVPEQEVIYFPKELSPEYDEKELRSKIISYFNTKGRVNNKVSQYSGKNQLMIFIIGPLLMVLGVFFLFIACRMGHRDPKKRGIRSTKASVDYEKMVKEDV